MTPEQRKSVINELGNFGIHCRYNDTYNRFDLFDVTGRGTFFLNGRLSTRRSSIFGFYARDYRIMRIWSDRCIKPIVSRYGSGWEYYRQNNADPDGEYAVWFNIRNQNLVDQNNNWLDQSQEVIRFATMLYRTLEEKGIFSNEFNPQNYIENNLVLQGINTMKQASELIGRIEQLLKSNLQVILTGAPGTGKTWISQKVAEKIVCEGLSEDDAKKEAITKQIKSVQFHPGYDYSDFVIGMKPVLQNGQVSFEWKSGIFKDFADKTKNAYDQEPENAPKFVFLIDEINRADLSRVFGELFSQLEVDYRYPRSQGIALPNGEILAIPANLYIIGTMNDIDRSVESMDFALRRRFAWLELKPEDTAFDILSDNDNREELVDRMNRVNAVIKNPETKLGVEYQLGGAIFAKCNGADYEALWNNHIKMTVNEYLRGRNDRETVMELLKVAYNNNTQHINQ